ncbi:hypothetical protein ACJX0J_040837, partial [Zea mays]
SKSILNLYISCFLLLLHHSKDTKLFGKQALRELIDLSIFLLPQIFQIILDNAEWYWGFIKSKEKRKKENREGEKKERARDIERPLLFHGCLLLWHAGIWLMFYAVPESYALNLQLTKLGIFDIDVCYVGDSFCLGKLCRDYVRICYLHWMDT